MIPPDQEIYEVEKRIADRRHRVEAAARNAGRQALRTLGSPWVLGGAAVLGFLAAGGLRRKHAHGPALSQETKEKAKGGVIASLLMAGVTWFIKAQFGSPVAMAQYFLAKIRKEDHTQPSPLGDRTRVTTRP
ncbi:MAG TPA: hypothetical protein VE756_02320 [Burkholderiales bacterium]|nr:hypothetical protein [Burkholderiales bacterium]